MDFDESNSVSLHDSIYYFNPCKTFNLPMDGDPYTVEGEQCHNVLGCKKIQQNQSSSKYYTNAIRLNSTVLTKITPLTIRYYGSKYKNFIFNLKILFLFFQVLCKSNNVCSI